MKTYETTTDICPIVNVGTYWGPFEYDRLWGDSIEQDREDGCLVCDDYDFYAFKEVLCGTVQRVFDKEKPLEPYGVHKVIARKIGSPREYNFRDDWLEFAIEVDDDWLDKSMEEIEKPEYREKVDKYIQGNWLTRDGFISSMPDSVQELRRWMEKLRDEPDSLEAQYDDCRIVGGILYLRLLVAGEFDKEHDGWVKTPLPEDMTDLVYERFICNHTHGDFMTVVDADTWKKEFANRIFDFGAYRKEIEATRDKYVNLMKDNKEAVEKAWNWSREVCKRLDEFDRKQQDIVAGYYERGSPKLLETAESELQDLLKEMGSDMATWQKYWKV